MVIDRVFLFVRDTTGDRWPVSLGEASHERFQQWATNWLSQAGRPDEIVLPETTPAEREAVILKMIAWDIAPAIAVELPACIAAEIVTPHPFFPHSQ